ncbi:MAG: hypothetical protein ABII02_00095 [Candidatus Magasanikbacteria bacterium]
MYLLIDTSQKEAIHLALFDKNEIFVASVRAQNRELLESIDSFFVSKDFEKEHLKGIVVVVGEGGFTSTRIAVTVANTFGYALQISLLAISKEQSLDPQALIEQTQSQPVGQYISASYSGEPNITKPKK